MRAVDQLFATFDRALLSVAQVIQHILTANPDLTTEEFAAVGDFALGYCCTLLLIVPAAAFKLF